MNLRTMVVPLTMSMALAATNAHAFPPNVPQAPDTTVSAPVTAAPMAPPAAPAAPAPAAPAAPATLASHSLNDLDSEPPVQRYDLSGPRVGMSILPDGTTISQFGWHSEHQASAGANGPAFLVQTVFLAGGVEYRMFLPSATLIFGARTPSGWELGLGPSFSTGMDGLKSGLVVAAGRSLKFGGIRFPVNVAMATSPKGQRVSVMTGWAIRNSPR